MTPVIVENTWKLKKNIESSNRSTPSLWKSNLFLPQVHLDTGRSGRRGKLNFWSGPYVGGPLECQRGYQARPIIDVERFFFFFFFLIIMDSTEKGDSLTLFVFQNGFEIIPAWSRLACSSAYNEILFTKCIFNKKDNFVKYVFK